ncbi:hypothetical protein FI667_g9108, partial [Globisporangium splendens]
MKVSDMDSPQGNYTPDLLELPDFGTHGVPVRFGCKQRATVFQRAARTWFAIRWKLAETIFARPIPWVTANLEFKLGDLLLTLPLAMGFLIWNALLCSKIEVKESGTPPQLMMLLVFALAVRNNSILLTRTSLPYERAVVPQVLRGHRDCRRGFARTRILARRRRRRILARRRLRFNDSYREPTLSTEASGAIIFCLLLALYVLSLNVVRRKFFELFLRMHWLLFIGIVVFSIIHGAGLVVVGTVIWAIDIVFHHGYIAPKYWKGSLTTTKHFGVLTRGQVSIANLPGHIVRIQFPKARADSGECFHYEADQYVFLCVPKLGYLEWHPFTISSSPHEALVTIHIKALGDWTKKLSKLAEPTNNSDVAMPAVFSILIDGPYGHVSIGLASPTKYSHVALFSGGIGITPMQSIVNQLYFEYHHQTRHALQKVCFVWSVRDRVTVQALFNRSFVESKKQLQHSQLPSPYLPDALVT